MKRIGFIGLGIMGNPMCKNLLKAGYSVTIYARKPAVAEEMRLAGAKVAKSPSEVGAQSDLIITMLPDSPQVREVVLGSEGVIEGAHPGSIVVDMSSIAPLVSREVGARLAEKSIRMLDAPVSGGEPKAIDGTLSIMVGGSPADFDECRGVLENMGTSVVLCGEIGAGNVTKLANQVIVAVNLAALSEALVLATKAGVDPENVYRAIRGGLAGSAVLDAKTLSILDRQFAPGFRVNLHIKDLNNVLETGHGVGVPLPLTALVMEMMQTLRIDGYGERDHSALALYYEKLAHTQIVRTNG